MGLTHARKAVPFDQLDDAEKPLPNVSSQRVELALNPSVQEFDPPCHPSSGIS